MCLASSDESESSWLKLKGSAHDLFLSVFLSLRFFWPFFLYFDKNWCFIHYYFCFSLWQTFIFLEISGFLGQKWVKLRKNCFELKSIRIASLVSARNLMCPSSARLRTFSARLNLSQRIHAQTHHYWLVIIVLFCLWASQFQRKISSEYS